ncbi:hypothetical protein ACWQTE_006042, partial [Pseudomonas aeruginosa]
RLFADPEQTKRAAEAALSSHRREPISHSIINKPPEPAWLKRLAEIDMGLTVTSTANRAELLLTREIDRFAGRRIWQRHHQSADILSVPCPRDESKYTAAESEAEA